MTSDVALREEPRSASFALTIAPPLAPIVFAEPETKNLPAVIPQRSATRPDRLSAQGLANGLSAANRALRRYHLHNFEVGMLLGLVNGGLFIGAAFAVAGPTGPLPAWSIFSSLVALGSMCAGPTLGLVLPALAKHLSARERT